MRNKLQELYADLCAAAAQTQDAGEARGLRRAAQALQDLLQAPPGLTLAEAERELVLWTLRAFANHKAATARALGICRPTLDRHLSAYGWPRRGYRRQPASAGGCHATE